MKKLSFLILLSTLLLSCNTNTTPGLMIETESILLYHGETAVLGASSENGLVYYKSSDNSIATVDNNGVVTANLVGTTYITVLDGKEAIACKITVTPRYFVEINPYVIFGASSAEVKSRVKEAFIEERTMSNNTAEKTLVYYNQTTDEKSRITYEYHFFNDKLISTGVFIKNGVDFFNELMYYLDETYYFNGEYKSTDSNSTYSYQRTYKCADQKSDLKVSYKLPVTEYYMKFSPSY